MTGNPKMLILIMQLPIQPNGEKHGPQSIALFGSPKLSNEQLYLIQKFGRSVLGTNNISSIHSITNEISLDNFDDLTGMTSSTATMDDFKKADVLVVMNADLSEDNLIMEMKIKEAQKNGTKLVLINSSEIKLTKFADLWVDSRKGTNTILMNGMIQKVIERNHHDKSFLESDVEGFEELKKVTTMFQKEEVCELTEIDPLKYDELADLISNPASNIVFIYNLDSRKEKSTNDLKTIANFLLLTNRMSKENNGIILLRDYSNSAGHLDMGINPEHLPGQVKFFEQEEVRRIGKKWNIDIEQVFIPTNLKEDLINGKIKAAIIFGEDPFSFPETAEWFKKIDFVLVNESFRTETVNHAEVILPAPTFLEDRGTYTNCEGRLQEKLPVCQNREIQEGWKTITGLASQFTDEFTYETYDEIYNEMCDVNRAYQGMKPDSLLINPVKKGNYYTRNKKANFAIVGYDVKTINPSKPAFTYSEMFFRKEIKSKIIY